MAFKVNKHLKALVVVNLCCISIGCQQVVDVKIIQHDSDHFEIRALIGDGRPACINSITFVDNELNDDVVLDIQRLPKARCRNVVLYPSLPRGYEVTRPVKKIIPDHKYQISVTGVGFSDNRTFTTSR